MENLLYLFYAFFAGLLTNIMPCSLIILLLKINRVINNADDDDNFIICLGISTVYLLLSFIIIFAKYTGSIFGWGMHMQNKIFILFLVSMLFYMTLVGLDIKTINFSSSVKSKNKSINNFITGFFIGVTSTSCNAPFLASVITFTLKESVNNVFTILMYLVMSLGVLLPFYLIGKSKALMSLIQLFKNKANIIKSISCLFSFTYMMWLLYIYKSLTDIKSYLIISFILVFFLLYLLLKFKKRKIFVLYFLVSVLSLTFTLNSNSDDKNSIWSEYNDQLPKNYFLYFTADWCQNCQVFEKIYLKEEKFKKCSIKFIKVDLTKPDDKLWDLLKKYNRSSLPTYVFKIEDQIKVLSEGPPITADVYFKRLNCLK